MPSRRLGQHRCEVGEGAARALAHALIGLQPVRALERLLALAFGQRDDAPRRAPPGADPRRALLLVDQHQLGRAAADVEDQRRPIAGLEQLVAAQDGEPRFLRGLDDVEHDAGLVAHPLGELAAVGGTAAGFGGDRARERDVAAPAACRRRRRVHRPRGPSPRPTVRRVRERPSPRRTIREKASMTVKPPSVGRAISRRQLLVPRSIAP